MSYQPYRQTYGAPPGSYGARGYGEPARKAKPAKPKKSKAASRPSTPRIDADKADKAGKVVGWSIPGMGFIERPTLGSQTPKTILG